MDRDGPLEITAPVLRRPGHAMKLERLRLEPPRSGEVRVRMLASGVCHSCLHAYDGSHKGIPMPIVLGDEGTGIVDAIGPDCAQLAVGDHVVLSWAPGCGHCSYCHLGRPILCLHKPPLGCLADGTTRMQTLEGEPVFHYGPATYAPYTVVAERAAVRLDADVNLEAAALVGCSVATGVGAAVNTAAIRPGQSAAVFGCGGIGLNAVQGAALAGAHPIIGVDITTDALELARAFGATDTLGADEPEFIARLRAIAPTGVDVAIVAVGASSVIATAVAALAPAGTCVIVGNPPTDDPLTIDPHLILSGERRLVGSVYGSINPHVAFPQLIELARLGRLKLTELVSRHYGLDESNEAFADLAEGGAGRGLIVFERRPAATLS